MVPGENMKNNLICFGNDTEFCLLDKSGNYKSAIPIVPGNKENPVNLGNNHLALYDNILAECCPNYGTTKEETLQNFQDCFQKFANLVHPFKLHVQASHTFPASECQNPEALAFGCMPELNAYEKEPVDPPNCPEGNYFRSCGGHIHLGKLKGQDYPLNDYEGRWWITRLIDVFVGIPSVLLDNDPTSKDRRKLYGGAGNMRPKDYGIEYRTLSNFWLFPDLVSLIYDLCYFTVNFTQENPNHQKLWENLKNEIRTTINEHDKTKAKNLLNNNLSKFLGNELTDTIFKLSEIKERDFYSSWEIRGLDSMA